MNICSMEPSTVAIAQKKIPPLHHSREPTFVFTFYFHKQNGQVKSEKRSLVICL